jgi:hypothetical protein
MKRFGAQRLMPPRPATDRTWCKKARLGIRGAEPCRGKPAQEVPVSNPAVRPNPGCIGP